MSIFEEMMKQYESSHNGKRDSGSQKTYDLKNYFNTVLPKGVDSQTKKIRILPPAEGQKTPFTVFWGHVKKIGDDYKTFPCLKHENDEDCPFCQAREALLATGKEEDKELAKEYSAKQFYIVKVIDRDNEADGVKFWRFKHNYKKGGVMDKMMAAIVTVNHNVTDIETGRDLNIVVVRDGKASIVQNVTYPLETSKLSANEDKVKEWTGDVRTWEDVYSVRNYDYLKIVVKGDTPVWDKDNKCYAGKLELESRERPVNNDDDGLVEELEIGSLKVETEKASTKSVITSDDDDDDDLPFWVKK